MPKKICISGGTAEIVEKKSRFIANVARIDSEQDALGFIESIKKKYWDARHNCFGYITSDGKILRFSDDKEPQGTAGKPILEVLQHREIVGICVVVTRYFGGILLGTGGLIRAYQKAAMAGVDAGKILEEKRGFRLTFDLSYEDYGRFAYWCEKYGTIQESITYTDRVAVRLVVEETNYNGLMKKISEESSGRIAANEEEAICYVPDEKNVLAMKP